MARALAEAEAELATTLDGRLADALGGQGSDAGALKSEDCRFGSRGGLVKYSSAMMAGGRVFVHIEAAAKAAKPPSRSFLRIIVIVLASTLIGTFAPSAATAADYTVNSIGDQADESPGLNGCKTAIETCTLRAAIEESNVSIGIIDTIKFSATFNGQIDDTIELTAPLPSIIDRVRIEGNPNVLQCETDFAAVPGPCVGVNGPPGETALQVEAEQVLIKGLAITGAQTGISASSAPNLDAWNNWIGVKLDGSAGPNETGISIDQASNAAAIGAYSSIGRNIIAHNTEEGLDIEGADNTSVFGNGFGILPNGNGLAPNGKNIEITDSATGGDRVAQGNWIGRTIIDADLETSVCDGGCNLISGAIESGIDLVGDDPNEEPASGFTRIAGNYIGLNAFGTTGIPNSAQGVLVGPASNVTIGGPRPGDRNMINGGDFGVLAGPDATNLTVEGNWIGLDPSGNEGLAPPTSAGIAIDAGHLTEVNDNRISMVSGTAIELGGQGAVIRSNTVGEGVNGESLPGGSIGMRLYDFCSVCSLVHSNSIVNAATYGLLIENSRNLIYANRIEGSGAAGIHIENPSSGILSNLIGGDSIDEENTISKSGGAAVEIVRIGAFTVNTRNEVARNHGEFNGGPFIDLVDGANGDIPPPVIASATQSGASGSGALAGARIRVFHKATSSPGELGGFLAEATADGAGHWEVTYPEPVASGTIVAATQTRLIDGTATPEPPDGTSELAVSTTAVEPEEPPPSEGGVDGGTTGRSDLPQLPTGDTTPPQTFLRKGPRRTPPARRVEFRFISSEPGSRFQCKLDSRPVRWCRSPQKYKRLGHGKHLFKVWAIDAADNKDRSPAKREFRIRKKRNRGRSTLLHNRFGSGSMYFP